MRDKWDVSAFGWGAEFLQMADRRGAVMTRGYVTPGEAGLIVFLVLMAAFIIVLVIGAGKNADDQYIDRESDMCVIRVTAPCGDSDICRYSTSVPCAEIESLIKNAGGRR